MGDHKMRIEVWSDVICPFCYIGKRNYEAALEKFHSKDNIQLTWRCFQLDPDIANEEGISTAEYLATRKNIPQATVKQLLENVSSMAEKAGLQFKMDKAIIANSFDAHRLSHLVMRYGKQNHLEELMFNAHFVDGKNIGDKDILVSLAEEAGVKKEEAEEVLNSKAYAKEVLADISEAEDFNIKGVPFFVINRKYAISGAQPPELFLEVLENSFKEWKSSVDTEGEE
ncbi:MAG: DsbA family oxidoreductase [Bacteroidia bacterium]